MARISIFIIFKSDYWRWQIWIWNYFSSID